MKRESTKGEKQQNVFILIIMIFELGIFDLEHVLTKNSKYFKYFLLRISFGLQKNQMTQPSEKHFQT
jgi:hypothetical protein